MAAPAGRERRGSLTNISQITKNLINSGPPSFIAGIGSLDHLVTLSGSLLNIITGGTDKFITVIRNRTIQDNVPPQFQNGENLARALEESLPNRTEGQRRALQMLRALPDATIKRICFDYSTHDTIPNTHIISDKGVILAPLNSPPPYEGSYRFSNPPLGTMKPVGLILQIRCLGIKEDGTIFQTGAHSVSYVCMDGNWYKADNEKGFLESRSVNTMPGWDVKYTTGAWFTSQTYIFLANIANTSAVPTQPPRTRSGQYSPFQYNSTCSPDSMSAVFMLADGYKQEFEKIYNLMIISNEALIDEIIQLLRSPIRVREVIDQLRKTKANIALAEAAKAAPRPQVANPAFNAQVAAAKATGKAALSEVMNIGKRAGESVPDPFNQPPNVIGASYAVQSCITDPNLSAEDIASRTMHPNMFLKGRRTNPLNVAATLPYTKELLSTTANFHALEIKPSYLLSPYSEIKYDAKRETKILELFDRLLIDFLVNMKGLPITSAQVRDILTRQAPPEEFKILQASSFVILMVIRKRTWQGIPNVTHYHGYPIGNAQNAGSRRLRKNRKSNTRKN